MRIQNLKQHKVLLTLYVSVAALVAACAAPVQSARPTQVASSQSATAPAPAATTDPIYLGVSGPLTGQKARYGAPCTNV